MDQQNPLPIYYFHTDFASRAKTFYEKYEGVNVTIQGDPKYSKRELKLRSERICRFCSRTGRENFATLAHLLPQLMGNKTLFSDFECDDCNKRFSAIENDLANFLGISRSISELSGVEKATGFKASKLSSKSRSFIGENILIIAPEDLKTEGTKTVINYTKNSYVPSNVYKALLKSALSLLDDSEIRDYRYAIRYLSDENEIRSGALISGYSFPLTFNFPLHTFLYKKKSANDRIPTHVVIFYFQNRIIAFPVPLHKNDMQFYQGLMHIIHPPPSFLEQPEATKILPLSFERDFSSSVTVDDEQEIVTLMLHEDSLKNSVVYNPATDEYNKSEFGTHGIKHLIITKGHVTVNPRELSLFLKKELGN